MASVSISCPSCSATDGVVRNGKSTAGHQRYLCSHCRKTWQLQFTYTASQPGTQFRKSLIWLRMALDAG
ncbi:IS1 family transposase [Escherichia coli]|uniref:IS1 family transposase n=1 Tax=Escherichia coli TaxID=562 RepID=UPI00288C038C|nr:IS1 family transposase [Escherichia coli]